MKEQSSISLSKRRAIKSIITVAAAAMTVGCGSDSVSVSWNGNAGSDTGNSDNSTGNSDSGTYDDSWASGGTVNMTANFPDDSLFESASTCDVQLTGQQTEGPCYFDGDYLDDISEGQTGLPMMLCLQLVDANCNPLSGYEIEIWHCDTQGLYSGDTTGSSRADHFNSSFCTGDNSQALASRWFRGTQVTDSSGRVNFKSCFPGWYSSRAIHVHFRVRNNNSDSLVSQFGFADDFCTSICQGHGDYKGRGAPDTLLAQDTVFGSDYADYLFDRQQNDDGSLLAYKRIVIA